MINTMITAVLTVLAKYPGVWISAPEVAQEAGLATPQVYYTVAAIRDAYPDVPICTKRGRDGGYRLTDDEDARMINGRGVLSYLTTMSRRHLSNLDRTLARIETTVPAKAPEARRARLSLERLIQDLTLVAP